MENLRIVLGINVKPPEEDRQECLSYYEIDSH